LKDAILQGDGGSAGRNLHVQLILLMYPLCVGNPSEIQPKLLEITLELEQELLTL
jgi:hypothetical protein